VKILYIAGVGTLAYRARHHDTAFEPGGLRKAQLSIDALTRAGHDVMMLSSAVTSPSRIEWRKEERERWALAPGRIVEVRYPATFPVRPVGGLFNSARAPWLARRLLEDFVPDSIVSYNSSVFESLASMTIGRRTGAPIILQLEDLPLSRRREYGNLKPWLDQRCWPHMLRAASAFTAVNQSILSMLPAAKPKRLLPGIIDDGLMRASELRSPPFSSATRSLGYFGALSEEKGVGVLLEVANSLPDAWRLRVTGTGPLKSEFEALARARPDRVEFLGNLSVDALYDALCSCDATAVPLERITGTGAGVFPFKVLEYLVARTHIISTPLPSIGEVDLGFIGRWDGSATGLVLELHRAEVAYREEQSLREAAASVARTRFSVAGASVLFSELLHAAHLSPAERGQD